MGALVNRINDELAKLAAEEASLDKSYKDRKTAIARRQGLLGVAITKVTDELEVLISQLGVNFNG